MIWGGIEHGGKDSWQEAADSRQPRLEERPFDRLRPLGWRQVFADLQEFSDLYGLNDLDEFNALNDLNDQ
jgi:hypothetical protein